MSFDEVSRFDEEDREGPEALARISGPGNRLCKTGTGTSNGSSTGSSTGARHSLYFPVACSW